MALHFARILGITARDLGLLQEVGKIAIASIIAAAGAGAMREMLIPKGALVVLMGSGAVFAMVYLALLRWTLALPASKATSAGVSAR
jgi:hypothetical protein